MLFRSTDTSNHVIRKVDHATGFITTVAGTGTTVRVTRALLTSGTVTFPTGTHLEINGATFTADGPTTLAPGVGLTMNCVSIVSGCGTLAGSGAVTIESTPTTPTNVTIHGGALSGTGVLTLTQDTNTTIALTAGFAVDKPVTNAGTWTQTSDTTLYPGCLTNGGSQCKGAELRQSFTNSGSIVFPDDTGYIDRTVTGAITNTGLITKTGTSTGGRSEEHTSELQSH